MTAADGLPLGVDVELLHSPLVAPSGPTAAAAARSHKLLEWLSRDAGGEAARDDAPRCDVAHFVDALAEALYPVLAQRQRLALPQTLLVLHAIAPLLWRLLIWAASLITSRLDPKDASEELKTVLYRAIQV